MTFRAAKGAMAHEVEVQVQTGMRAHCDAEDAGEGALPAQAARVHGRPHLALQFEGHDAVRDGPVVEASRNVAASEPGHNLSLR